MRLFIPYLSGNCYGILSELFPQIPVQDSGMLRHSCYEVRRRPRACLKKAFRELRVPVCGRFRPNEGGVAGLRQPNKGKIYRKVGLADRGNVFSNTLQIRSHNLSVLLLHRRTFCKPFFLHSQNSRSHGCVYVPVLCTISRSVHSPAGFRE